MRVSLAKMLAGRASLVVAPAERSGRPVLELVLEARSQGFFAWLTRFKVEDRTVAAWDPGRGCSLGIEKRLREGRHRRDQRVVFDPQTGVAEVEDPRLSAPALRRRRVRAGRPVRVFRGARRGVGPRTATLPSVRTFDNGRLFDLRFHALRTEQLDLPAPLGRRVPTRVFEVLLVPETGVFEQQGRLLLWVTDDERRIPVRLRAKAPVGWVSADLESYRPPTSDSSLSADAGSTPTARRGR